MMRLKPSVSSCSAAAGFSLTAASAMGGSLYSSQSIQIVGVFLDVLGEAERVIANQLLGARGVARFERLDDVHVIADRFLDPVLLGDGLAPDHPHVGEQVRGQRNEHAVAAH